MAFDYSELQTQLSKRQQANLYRQRKTVQSPQGALVSVDGESYLNFCSNDYLGLANHPLVKAAAKNAIDLAGFGGGASHLVCGHHDYHHQVESYFAKITGRESALLFSTGFMANLGVIAALCDKQDAVFEDKWNHASLIDGGLLSGAKFQRFLHNDMQSLEKKLARSTARRKLICVDGVFSMDGDKAPLPELAALADKYNALLMVDDAHGFGCLGEKGLGICEEQGLSEAQAPLLMCTLGKALGSFGAVVAGPKVLIDTLVQYARPYIYTTSMPPAVAAATLKSLELLSEEPWRREKLQSNIQRFRAGVSQIGLNLMASDTAIQPLLVGDDALAIACQQYLQEQGIWISAIRPPTVPAGTARLRITLSAEHSDAQIDQLLSALAKLAKHYPALHSNNKQETAQPRNSDLIQGLTQDLSKGGFNES